MARREPEMRDPSMRLSAYKTTPLEDVVREVDPSVKPEHLRRELKEFLAVSNARHEAHHIRGAIDLREDSPLFGGPVLNLYTGSEVADFQSAWRAFRACSPVTENDRKKIEAIWPGGREEPLIGKDEIVNLRRVREQAQLPGYITAEERASLDKAYGEVAELERLHRRASFERLGLTWKERDGREEPAKSNSRFIDATFPQMSSHYFEALLKNLSHSSLPPEDRRELGRIYDKCRALSKLREEGHHGEAAEGWRKFLERELYPRFGGHENTAP
ncbi:MAG: hypothetical protein RL417_1847 [Pseudomonadota bacterium]|jgi:hypothetical protein